MAHTQPPPGLAQVPLNPKDRPHYTPSQLATYFTRIHLPAHALSSPIISNPSPSLARSTTHGLPLLRALTTHHLASIPFEDLELHYSPHKTISLHASALFHKFAERGTTYGRGGRCMENNGFFATVLRSLGYDVRNCAGRVSRAMSPVRAVREQQGHTYDGWNHMLNLVRLGGDWWVVDVGMGAMGPNVVYPLQDGVELESIAPRRIRLQKRRIPESYDEAGQLWCFDVCHKPDAREGRVWIPTYCFTETEFLPQDYEMMSYFTSTNRRCFFTYSLVCTKMLLEGGDGEERIVGDVTLFNDVVRKNVGEKREVLRTLGTEEERVTALREVFGVELTEEERGGLRGELRLGSSEDDAVE